MDFKCKICKCKGRDGFKNLDIINKGTGSKILDCKICKKCSKIDSTQLKQIIIEDAHQAYQLYKAILPYADYDHFLTNKNSDTIFDDLMEVVLDDFEINIASTENDR